MMTSRASQTGVMDAVSVSVKLGQIEGHTQYLKELKQFCNCIFPG